MAVQPVTLKFHDVVYEVRLPKRRSVIPKKEPYEPQECVVLKGITGMVMPGEMLAILGPSGSGKTTLLTALGGRLGGELKGMVTYNGKPFSKQVERTTAFVTQDDVLYAHLTVLETLVYTALLRLPKTLSREEKIAHAEAVVLQLGLTRCKNTMIGGPIVRGISAGEKKRVSIGQELLIDPSLLLLDEPTSGLDSTMAQRIMSAVLDLAREGRTIVVTIHQPSSSLFYMFHKVLLLSEGNALYFGRGLHVMDYFESAGFAPSVPMNPADFLLELANGVPTDNSEDPVRVKEKLILAYKNHIENYIKQELQQEDQTGFVGANEPGKIMTWPNTWWQEFSVLLRRGLKERKHETFDALKTVQVIAVALTAGLLWWQSSLNHLGDQIGLQFFTSGFWNFLPVSEAVFTFPPERMILAKERSSGMYRLSSYFMARMVSDIPVQLVLATIFVIISYWMAGLKHTATAFLHYLCSLLLGVLVAQGLGLAIGALVMDLRSATILGSVIMFIFYLTGGYYIHDIPPFISWIKYLSVSNYNYKMLLGSQYKPGETYPCGAHANKQCLMEDFPPMKAMGLKDQHVSFIVLLIMFIGYRLIAYVALMRIGVIRKKSPC